MRYTGIQSATVTVSSIPRVAVPCPSTPSSWIQPAPSLVPGDPGLVHLIPEDHGIETRVPPDGMPANGS